MKKIIWMIILLSLLVSPIYSQIIITEVMYDALGSEQTDEFIEIYNAGDIPIDLSGWRIGDGTGDDALIETGSGLVLEPSRYAVILDADYFSESDAYEGLIPDTALVLTIDGSTLGSGGLSNSTAEIITLFDASGAVADQYQYSLGNAHGHSDERIDLNPENTEPSWGESQQELGTPGFQNSIAQLKVDLAVSSFEKQLLPNGDVKIAVQIKNIGSQRVQDAKVFLFQDVNADSICQPSETLFSESMNPINPDDSLYYEFTWGPDSPGNHIIGVYVDFPGDERQGNNVKFEFVFAPFPELTLVLNEIMAAPQTGQPEWIEIFNPSEEPIDLSGWMLSDLDTSKKSVIHNTCLISPGEYVVLCADTFETYSDPINYETIILHGFPSLNNSEESVILYDPTERIIDECVYFETQSTGISLERIRPKGQSEANNWHACTALEGSTPGKQNSVYFAESSTETVIRISPNPFSPDGDGREDIVLIEYTLPVEISVISLRIFDIHGREICALRSSTPTGSTGQIVWDGKDYLGRNSPVGIYIVSLEAVHPNRGKILQEKTTLVLAKAF